MAQWNKHKHTYNIDTQHTPTHKTLHTHSYEVLVASDAVGMGLNLHIRR